MYKFVFSHKEEGQFTISPESLETLTSSSKAPKGFDQLQYAFSRSSDFWGIFRKYTAKLQFVDSARNVDVLRIMEPIRLLM
jgi:hypothetical protein